MPVTIEGCTPLLFVYDMDASLHFYCSVLGFDIVQTSDQKPYGWVWLRHGDADVMLNTMYEDDERPPVPDNARIVAHEDAALFFSCPDVDGAYEHLRANGVIAEPPKTAWYGMRQLSFKDPDGFALCLQQRGAIDRGG